MIDLVQNRNPIITPIKRQPFFADAADRSSFVRSSASDKMASTRKQKFASSKLLVMIMILIMMGRGSSDSVAMADAAKYSALFVLGDSLVDVGNNNFISTVARSDMKPFGIDFAQGPTGRFCNGKVVVDFIGKASSEHVLALELLWVFEYLVYRSMY
jgi:hypothetical protein